MALMDHTISGCFMGFDSWGGRVQGEGQASSYRYSYFTKAQ